MCLHASFFLHNYAPFLKRYQHVLCCLRGLAMPASLIPRAFPLPVMRCGLDGGVHDQAGRVNWPRHSTEDYTKLEDPAHLDLIVKMNT